MEDLKIKTITKEAAVEALKQLFDYENNKESKNVIVATHEDKTTFMINKQYLEREEVIRILADFFGDKVFNEGQCRVEPITLLWTAFHIEDRNC